MKPVHYLAWLIGFVFALLFGPLSLATPAAAAEPSRPSYVYTEGITAEEFYRTYHQTLCYDYQVIKGSLENALESGLVTEVEGLYYGANAGVSWGECATRVQSAPDLYITSCVDTIGGMNRTYGWSFERGWVTDSNGVVLTYLIHATDSHPCDAGAVAIFDDEVYPTKWAACKDGPVLYALNGASVRCDANPITAGAP